MGPDVIYEGERHLWGLTSSMERDVIYAGNVIYGAGRHL